MISIKEVTKQTGITVRTMRYYDEINLLPPAGKTDGGHRLYGEQELKKLQEIQFLKSLGFNLHEIKEMLSDDNWDWAKGLEEQLSYILSEKQKILEIENTLKGLINSVTIDGSVDLVHINKLVQLYQDNYHQRKTYREKYFHEKEQHLLERLPNINSDDPDSLEWVTLLGDLKKHMHKGVADADIQLIINRFHEKIIETYGENDAFFDKVWEIRKSPEKSQQVGFYPIDQETLTFFEKAWDVFEENNKNQT